MTEAYAKVSGVMTRYLSKFCNHADAQEIAQEAFIKFWGKREQFDPSKPLEPYLCRIARNLYYERGRKPKVELVYSEEEANNVAHEEEGPISPMLLKWRLLAAISQLPKEFREAYILAKVRNLSVKEIADRLKTNESVVKVRIHRAKLKLAEMLQDLKKES